MPIHSRSDEFASADASPATEQIDLLTVFAHEFGHLLGLPHTNLTQPGASSLMVDLVPQGTRRLPQASDVAWQQAMHATMAETDRHLVSSMPLQVNPNGGGTTPVGIVNGHFASDPDEYFAGRLDDHRECATKQRIRQAH